VVAISQLSCWCFTGTAEKTGNERESDIMFPGFDGFDGTEMLGRLKVFQVFV
jgi:hypothetical protein